jgi:hypothetical protein
MKSQSELPLCFLFETRTLTPALQSVRQNPGIFVLRRSSELGTAAVYGFPGTGMIAIPIRSPSSTPNALRS